MIKKWIFPVVLLHFIGFSLYAQNRPLNIYGSGQGSCVISGVVINDENRQPVEYTSIAVYSVRDSSLVSGGITDDKGKFEIGDLPFGKYWIEADFIGFDKQKINTVILSPEKPKVSLPVIKLKQSNIHIEGVEVLGEKSRVSYKIDKKVINVSQDINAQSGSAADVLENVPSVNVDIEGNVTLRGSSEFTVLVNGRPSAIEGSDALQQIPASTIENIEIITNPSAKYDPDGTAGIINVITKKRISPGLTGLVDLSAGTQNNYKTDVLINYKTNKYSLTANFDYGKRYIGINRSIEQISYSDTVNYLNSEGDMNRKRENMRIKLGIEYYLTKNTTIALNGGTGLFEFGFGGNSGNREWLDPYDSTTYYSDQFGVTRDRTFIDGDLTLIHKFDNDDHVISASIFYSQRTGGGEDRSTEWYTDVNGLEIQDPYLIENTKEDEDSREIRTNLDYVKTLNGKSKLEAGYQVRIARDIEDNTFETYDDVSGWVINPDYTSHMDYTRDIHSVYTIYSNEFFGLQWQAGLRTEYTNRNIYDELTDTSYVFEKIDVFPSLHLSKTLLKDNEIFVSYSRRINRPRGWSLEPFTTFRGSNIIRRGNPGLKPEYIDSYELGWQKKWGKSFLSVESYYRLKNNIISRIVSEQENGITLHTFENINRDHSLGVETMINFVFKKWLVVNASGDIFYYNLEGRLYDEDIINTSVNWKTRMNTTFRFSPFTRLQLILIYTSPTATAQGTRKEFFITDMAVRQELLNRKLNVTLQVKDIFHTMKREYIFNENNFYEHVRMQHDKPVFLISVNLKLNNYKSDKRNGQMNDGENGGDFEI